MKLIKCLVETSRRSWRVRSTTSRPRRLPDTKHPRPCRRWDWEHDKMVDTTARVKTILSIYRGS